jgi:hypothetical protein
MTKDNDESHDQPATEKPEACPRLPPQRLRRRQQAQKGTRNAGLRGRHTGHPREGLALARHRNGTHRKLKQTVICEIPDPLSVSTREFEVFAVILREDFNNFFPDEE